MNIVLSFLVCSTLRPLILRLGRVLEASKFVKELLDLWLIKVENIEQIDDSQTLIKVKNLACFKKRHLLS